MTNVRIRLTRYLLFLLSSSFILLNIAQADVTEGEKLFKSNCIACHAINEKIVGPALKDVDKRHNQDWLVKWIRNSQAMINSGDTQAVKVFNENKKVAMATFEFLKDSEIKSILEYIKVGGAPEVKNITTRYQNVFYTQATLITLSVITFLLFIITLALYLMKKDAIRKKELFLRMEKIKTSI